MRNNSKRIALTVKMRKKDTDAKRSKGRSVPRRHSWRVKLTARETKPLRHINCVHLQKAADTVRIGSGTSGVATHLSGKRNL